MLTLARYGELDRKRMLAICSGYNAPTLNLFSIQIKSRSNVTVNTCMSVLCVFNDLISEVVVHIIDIGGVVGHFFLRKD